MAKKSEERSFRKSADFADCQAAKENWQKLAGQQKELTAELAGLEQECGADPDGVRAEASALVKGRATTLVDHREQLVEARRQLGVVSEAATQQMKVWSALEIEMKAKMVEERLPQHKRLIEAINKPLDGLEVAISAERHFTEQLHADGGKLQPPMASFVAGRDLGLMPQRADMWRTHMRKCGYLEE